ncbi:MAG: BlaI/MecI/CopY family transcriptional regulator [Lactobacillales bacterium]|jgi:predicted transcriptional regulator|nr:BlaI/MecI/CopY family transcriptional regulator [Lactobacillales bacterium]
MNKVKISDRELEVLEILWRSDKALTAKQISEEEPHLVISTIQSTLKKLMKKELIKVDDIIYSGTVLTRAYTTCTSRESFVLSQYQNLKFSKLLSLFLGQQSKENLGSELDKIEEILKNKRKNL